jgi:acyl-CoA thioester hydrolase
MGVAHHSAYAPWLEIGRTELLRAAGVSYAQLEASGIFLVIVRMEIKYRRPARYDDEVEIRTTWAGGSRVKIEHEYEVVVVGAPGDPRRTAAVASTTLGCVDAEGSIRELPPWLAYRP